MSNNFNWDNLLEKAKKRDSQQAQKNAISPERYYKDQLGENYSNLEDKYKSLKKANKDAYKNARNAYWKDSVKGTLTFWDDSDDVTKEQKTAYQKSKDTYKIRKDALEQEYDNAQKNEWYFSQKENMDLIANDAELNELLAKAYDAKTKYEGTQEEIKRQQQQFGTQSSFWGVPSELGNYSQENLDIYNSVADEVKKAGYDFDDLLDTYTRQQNAQLTEDITDTTKKIAQEHPILSGAAYTALRTQQLSSVDDILADSISNAVSGEYQPTDINAPEFAITNIRDTIAEQNTESVYQSVMDKTDNEKLANNMAELYQTGLSTGDTLITMWSPLASTLSVSSDALASGVKDATKRGASADKAGLYGTITALNESIGEGLSLGKFNIMKASGKHGFKNFVFDLLKSTVVNTTEEFTTEGLNEIADRVVNGVNSQYQLEYQQCLENGLTEDEAKEFATKRLANRLKSAAKGGALQGLGFGAFASSINNVNISKFGKDISLDKKAVNDLFAAADALDKGTKASNQVDKIRKSKGVSNNAIGGLYLQTVEDYKAKFEKAENEKELIDMFNSVAPNLKGQIGSDIATVYIEARQKLIKKSVSSEKTQADTANNTESAEMLYRADEKTLIEQSEQSYSPSAKVANTGIHEALDGNDLGIEVVDTRTNQPVKIKGVEYSSAGEMTFVTDKGEDIEISDLDVSNQHLANVINTASQFDTNGANAFIKYAPRDHNFNTYTIMASNAYKVSRTQPELTFEQVKGSLNSVIRILGMDVTRKFFDAGKRDAQINKAATELITNVQKQNKSFEIDKKKSKTVEKFEKALNSDVKPGATVIAKNLQSSQKVEVELINEFAKSFNREVIIVTDLEELGYAPSNGIYTKGKIVLPLNADGGMMSVYLGHELFHDLKQTAPKQADALEKFIIDKLKNSPLYEYDKRVEEIIDNYKFKGTREQQVALANEEIAGNACFTVLSEQANFEQLVKQDKKLAQKVRDFFADFIDKIKKALKTVAQTNKEYRALQGDIEAKEQILVMFDEALKASNQATKNPTKNSNITIFGRVENFEKLNQDSMNNIKMRKGVVINNETELINAIKISISDNQEKTNYSFGAIPQSTIIQLKDKLGNKIKLQDKQYAFIFSSDDIKHIKKHYANESDIANALIRLYDTVTNYDDVHLEFWGNQTRLIFEKTYNDADYLAVEIVSNKKRAFDLVTYYVTKKNSETRSYSLANTTKSGELASQGVSYSTNSSISNKGGNVKNSLKDSEGNILSEEQQKFFADSKVRDEDGRLIPVYHGSNAEFTVFDRNRKGQGNDQYGAGFYFGTNTEISDMYGSNTYKSYLNITNPIKVHQAKYEGNNWFDIKITQQQAMEILKRHPLMYDEEESPLGDFYDSYWENGVEDWMIEDLAYKNANIGYLDSNLFRNYPNELHEAIKDVVGYDGVEVTFEGKDEKFYVAWFENQIKLTDNLNPTEDVDIRYSRKERSFSNALSREEWARFYSSISGDTNKNALLIGDNGVMVQDKDDANKYKLVVYEPMEENIDVEAVYLLENYDYNVHSNQTNIAKVIVELEMDGVNEKFTRKILRAYPFDETTIFRRYNRKSRRFVTVAGYKRNDHSDVGTSSSEQSNRTGISERAGEVGKYSRKEKPIDVDQLLEENEELSAMNEQLQEMLAIARKETTITGRHNLSRNFVDNVAIYLRQNYGSTYSKRSLSARLDGLYDYIANAGVDIDNDYIWRTAKDIAIELLDATTHKDTTVYDQYADLRNRIKSTAVIVSDEVKGDMADYNEFRKHNFGRLRLVNDGGISLDTFYNELAQEYPEMFDADAVLGDQLESLANVFEITQPVYYNSAQQYAESEGLSLDEYANIIASDIFNKYFDVIETKTFAEKKQKEFMELKVKYQNQIENMRKSYRDDYEQRLKAEKAKNKLKVDKAKDALVEQKIHFNSQIEKKRERRKIKAYRESIKKVAFELADWLEKPKKEKSVPDKFQKVLLEFLNSLNFESYNYYGELTKESIKWSDKASKLASQLNHLNSSQNDFGYVEIPAHISKTLDSIIDEYGDVPLNEIDAFGLKYLDDALHYLKGVVTQSHKLHNNEKYETIQALGKASIEQLEAKKGFKKDNLAVQYLNFDMLDSFSYAKMLGDAGQSIFDSLYRGFEKSVRKVKEAQDYLEKMLDGINTKNWTGPKAKMTKFELQNGTVHLTPAMCMEIYLLSQREQGRKHLLGKGIVLSSDIEKITKNKLNKKLNIDAKLEQVTPISLTLDDVYKITDSLTSEQKKVADKMQRYLATTVADWGNEVTMQMYMHRGFTDKDYWTVESFNDFVKTNDENSNNASLWAIINQSFTHQTIKNADNAVVIHDAFDTFAKHTEQMINYNAYAVPLSNAMKWFNYRDKDTNQTIKNCLHATYGTGATNYFLKFIKDLNGVKEPVDTYASRIPSVLTRNLKTAAVVSNIRVTVQQPMSYFKAWAVMDSKYLSKAIFSANGAKKAKEYCAIALWKSWGFYETDLGKNVNNVILNNQSTLDKIRDKSMILSEKADELTWGYLWNACELEIADKNKELKKGSEEFNKAVADRLTEIINETQVVDSVFHRSQIARSKSDLVKMSTSFMSEAIKSYNMLRNAYMDVRENPNSNNKKKFVRTTTAFVITQVAVSAVSSLIDTIRYNDDDEEWYETYAEYLKDNLINNLNPFNIIPLVKDIMSTAQGWESGRMDMTAIGDIIKVAINWGKRALGDSKRTLWEDIYDSAQAISNLTGMPFGNALRDLKAIVNIFTKKNIGKVYTNNERYQKLYEYQMEGDQKNYDKVYQELIDAQVEQNDIDNGMKMALFNNDARVAQAGISYSSGEMNEFINLSEEIINDGFSEQAVIDAIKHYAQKLEDAKIYLDDEDQDGYESILEKLTQSGYPEEEIVNAINSITIEEQMKDDSVSQIYSEQDLVLAIDNEDYHSYKKMYSSIIDIHIQNGKSQAEAENKVKSSLKSSFIDEYLSGDDYTRNNIERKLIATGLFDNDDFPKWLADSYNSDQINGTNAMIAAFEGGYSSTQRYVQERIQAKVNAGQTENNAKKGIRSSISSEYKNKFIYGNADTRARIIIYMTYTGLYGNRKETIEWLNENWNN